MNTKNEAVPAARQERPHDAAAAKQAAHGHVTAFGTVDREAIERLAAELERRREAARRLPPLPDGRSDPVLGPRSDGAA